MSRLLLEPQNGTFDVGQDLIVQVFVDGADTINVAGIEVLFPANLTVRSVDFTGSPFVIQAEQIVEPGRLKMSRGLAGGTSASGRLLFVTVVFGTVSRGASGVMFGSACEVLRFSDATDVLSEKVGGDYTIRMPGPVSRLQLGQAIQELGDSVDELEAVLNQ